MKLFLKCKKYLILYFNLLVFTVKVDKALTNNSNITPARDFETIFKYQNFQELNNIPNLGELKLQRKLLNENIEFNRIYEKSDIEKRFKTRERNYSSRDRKSRTNELHKYSKYWLKKLGIPKELPPSAWCNDEGVIVGIPITNNISKLLNEKIKSINGRQLPLITEDFLDTFNENNQNEQLYSKGLSVACNGKAVISNSFYEISDNKKIDSLIISFPENKDCEFVNEFSTDKYRYRIYKVDPFDRRLWIDEKNQARDWSKINTSKNVSNGRNVRTAEWDIAKLESTTQSEFELPSTLSIISVCISRIDSHSEKFEDSQSQCYSNVRWYKSVRGRLLYKSETGKLEDKIVGDGKHLLVNDLRDSSMFGMLLSSIFTAGVKNNINVPNDEDEHIFFNKLDVKDNGENTDYIRKIYLWPSYCEYKTSLSQPNESQTFDNNKRARTKINENEFQKNIEIEKVSNKDNVKIIVKNGCPVQGVKLNILKNTETLLIFSLFDNNWNLLPSISNQSITMRCAIKLYKQKQTLESQGCLTSKLDNSINYKSNTNSEHKKRWTDFNKEFNNKDEKEEIKINYQEWSERKWDDYFNNPSRRMLVEGQWSFNPNLRLEQAGVRDAQPNTAGLRSEITGKSILNTPKVGRESVSGGSGNRSYFLFNKQHAENLGYQNIHPASVGGLDVENDQVVTKLDSNLYSRRLPSEPMIKSVFQNILWRDWLIRYAPLVGNNGNFVRVGTNFAFAFLGESYIEEAATLGFSYDRAILSYLSGKRLSQLGRFLTFGYTQGLYGVRVDRSSTINAWGVDLQARYFISSTLASFGLREYAQHISVREIGLSLRHSFSQKEVIVGQQFSTEAIASYKTLFVDVATNVKNKSYGLAVGLRGYQFTVVRNFSTRTTDFLGNWGNGWQLLLSSTFPRIDDPTIIARAGAGRLGRSFVLAGAGIGRDMVPIVSFQTQLDDVGIILEFSPSGNDKIFAYGIEINHFAYFWESIFSAERVPVPIILGVEPKELSNAIFG